MRYTMLLAGGLAMGVASLYGCEEVTSPSQNEPVTSPIRDEGVVAPELALQPTAVRRADGKLDLELCSPRRGGFTLESGNDYFPLGVGSRWVFEGEEDGEALRLRITVLNETETVAGVRTRVVEEVEWVDGELFEVSRNFYALARDETVCYFGEDVDIYENGGISHQGAWRADAPGNRPGIYMPADPRVGMKFQLEVAPGVAEDEATIVGVGTVRVPAGRFRETIRVREFNPLDGGTGIKVYAEDVGLIIDGPLSLVRFQVKGHEDD